ncbi:hypothetical protein AD006_01125 [Pseudonocardia sp. EC080610-09]|nr:hypothetical protein FRP1_21955 [Pseudonocardia sp. EC080625-04]ALL74269.1 hypothetical protein AD006_01125 [Pseudonocardia sp. EC080610-09]ALL81292.1 hypothetical protein AD017_08950 [Pseudonocardia sp. EC080619-01]
MMIDRFAIDQLDDLTVALAELKLEAEDAPLVWLAEELIQLIKGQGSPTSKAALAAQLVTVLRELGATPAARGGTRPSSDELATFRK